MQERRVYLAALETRANQRYVFSSNKLAEIAGASELIARVGSSWLREALVAFDLPGGLVDEDGQPSADQARAEEGAPVEVAMASSGVVQLLSEDAGRLRDVVAHVTASALARAPGLAVSAAVSSEFDWEADSLDGPFDEVYGRLGGGRPSGVRFLRLPPVADCVSTGLPAAGEVRLPDGPERRSHEAMAKRAVHGDRLPALLGLLGDDVPLPRDLGVIERLSPESWFAVVHADANHLGRLFAGVRRRGHLSGNRGCVDEMRALSRAVAASARHATAHALREVVAGPGEVPLLPLILGGDDLLVAGEAGVALRFAVSYLREFEAVTATDTYEDGAIAVLQDADEPGLRATAGVAVVKAHHPFADAADLAYDLVHAGKGDRMRSRVDFAVAYGSASRGLDAMRVARPGELALWGGPYRVSPGDSDGADASWDALLDQVDTLRERDDDGRFLVPRGQVRRLRDLLRTEVDTPVATGARPGAGADAAFEELCDAHDAAGRLAAGPGGRSLVRWRGGTPTTMLVDALALEDVFERSRADVTSPEVAVVAG